MDHLWSESFSRHSSSREQDILIKNILLTHDPDGRDLDDELLLRVVEIIMYHATTSQVSTQQQDFFDCSIEVDGSHDPTMDSIYKILCEILCKCYGDKNMHARTLCVFELLGSYKWEAKLVLVVSAFAMVYGEFWVIMQAQKHNMLAASIALLKRFPNSFSTFQPIFTALNLLVETMVDVIRCVMQFEGLPVAYLELRDENITSTKSTIYAAAYWVVRSIMVCVSLLTSLRAIKDEQGSKFNIVWEITSLKSKISTIGTQLKTQVDTCQKLTEKKMREKLENVFQKTNFDNQELLQMLFASRNDLPLKRSSEQPKLGISSLKDKVVIMLISQAELAIEELLLLLYQTYDHPLHRKLDESYGILWLPVQSSEKWSNKEITTFTYLSNSLSWYTIRQPWSLNLIAINYVKDKWQFSGKPIMVILDTKGTVTNVNAADMVCIWGAKAYPFSTSREKDLWRVEEWNLQLLLDNIDPLLTMWVEEGRTICICGSNKLDWIRELSAQIKEIQCLVSQLQVVFVGQKGSGESNIVSVIGKEKLSYSLSLTKMYFFWRRLESMRRSKLRLGSTTENDHILRGVETLLANSDNGEDWMIIGTGSSTDMITLQGNEWVKFLAHPSWKRYLPKIKLEVAIRHCLKPPATEPCSHTRIVRYNKGLMEKVVCENCKHPVEKFIIYDVVE